MGSGPSRRPRRRKRPRRSLALACYGQAWSWVEARRVTARSAGAGLCPKTPQRSKAEGDKHGGRFDEQVRSTPSQAVAAGESRCGACALVVLGEQDARLGVVRFADDREPGAACRVIHEEETGSA